MAGSLAPGTSVIRERDGYSLRWITDDDSGGWREDMEAKTGMFPRVASKPSLTTLSRSTSVPRNGTTCLSTAENR